MKEEKNSTTRHSEKLRLEGFKQAFEYAKELGMFKNWNSLTRDQQIEIWNQLLQTAENILSFASKDANV